MPGCKILKAALYFHAILSPPSWTNNCATTTATTTGPPSERTPPFVYSPIPQGRKKKQTPTKPVKDPPPWFELVHGKCVYVQNWNCPRLSSSRTYVLLL